MVYITVQNIHCHINEYHYVVLYSRYIHGHVYAPSIDAYVALESSPGCKQTLQSLKIFIDTTSKCGQVCQYLLAMVVGYQICN